MKIILIFFMFIFLNYFKIFLYYYWFNKNIIMKKRNTYNSKYHLISNPKPINENTGNFAVSEKYLFDNSKDFLFEWINPKTNKLEIKVLAHKYVVNHLKKIPKWKEDELLKNKKIAYMFWMITYKDILNY